MSYFPKEIEIKWQTRWEQLNLFQLNNDINKLKKKPKYYILDMFPYPSGRGLHVGHPRGYAATDVIARMKRMQGFNVLHPMGWDSFGLPAERAAIRSNIHPSKIVVKNIIKFKKQIKNLGLSYDWNREISTSSVNYYKWTQWIFIKLYKMNLAYLKNVAVNFCPALSTVLANEEISDGRYIETGDFVEKRFMKQWMLKISSYAERLLTDLNDLDWPEHVKNMQKNWIGKSSGILITFKIINKNFEIKIFTTRPEIIFGISFLGISPENKLIKFFINNKNKKQYLKFKKKEKLDLATSNKNLFKYCGFFTNLYGINPFNKKKIPIWISNHVSNLHGTGCVLGVPAHDFDDFLFSKKNNLKIIPIINKNYSSYENEPYTNNGILFNSGFLNKKSSVFSKHLMFKFLKKSRLGKKKTFYRLRDWLFSRQRYWGEPFPIIYIKKKPVILSEENLPIILPKIQDYELKNGKPPLSKAKKWASVRIDNKFGVRELNTMPQWAGSCWYYLRFIDSKNNKKLFSSKLEKYFMPVDLYVGGVEHAVLHLLYARFWHKVLYDCKIVSTKEPFLKLFNQGMILSNSFKDKNGKYYDKENIYFVDKKCYSKEKKLKINVFIEKMSKSKNNIINPDEIIDKYGADTLRMYELFMGPLDQTQIWNMSGLNGIYRFLNKIWNLFTSDQIKILNDQSVNKKNEFIKIHHVMNKAIKKITNDTLLLKFNTAISELMIFFNKIKLLRSIPFLIVLNFLKILYPYAPHISEELWEKLGNKSILSNLTWPIFKINRISDKKTIILQINGKKKEILKNLIFLNNDDLKNQALESLYVKKYINIKNVKNIFFIKEKIINIIIN